MRSLLAASVVDELELLVAPIAIGAGKPLLGPDGGPVALTIAASETWTGGTVRLRYSVG